MKNITFKVSTYEWECDCCGSGEHYKIHVPELNKTFSRNDQFGGKLNKEHDDFPEFVKYESEWTYVLSAYVDNGYEVTVRKIV